MNGAIAEPWVMTIRPPKTNSMTKIGMSQNFLRARMNVHNSRMIDMTLPSRTSQLVFSELIFH
jgi:hypothetical protein